MQEPNLKERIEQQTLSLYRGRLICNLIRKEGLLSDNANLVLRLARDLLSSFAYSRGGHL